MSESQRKLLLHEHLPPYNCTSIITVNTHYQLFECATYKQEKQSVWPGSCFLIHLYNEDQFKNTGWKAAWQEQDEYTLTCLIAPG